MPAAPPVRRSRFGRRTAHANRQRLQATQRTNQETEEERHRIAHAVQNVRNPTRETGFLESFERDLSGYSYKACLTCNGLKLTTTSNLHCTACTKKPTKFSADNNMHPGIQPDALQDLTPIEQMLISRVQPILRVYQVRACRGEGQLRYSGNILNIEQDLQPVATTLPLMPKELNVILVRRAGMAGYTDFRVRRAKVSAALSWLIRHNPFYSDLTINYEAMSVLPPDGDIVEQLRFLEEGVISNEELEVDNIATNGLPILQDQNQRAVISDILQWPQADSNPINEFRHAGYIVKAFPHLFPYGKADFHDYSRTSKVTFREWTLHMLRFKDKRFAQDPRFRYFCLNTIQRHDALQRGTIYANISNFNGTVEDLLCDVNRNPAVMKRLLHIGSKIAATGPYWYSRRMELEAMVLQLGVPTFFLTLSSADLWWPCLTKHFEYDPSNKTESVMSREMQKLLSSNPLIADEYFAKRVEMFVNLLRKKYQINDYWYRFEYQHRGSPHVHGVFWIEGAPDVRKFPTMTIEQLMEAKDFYDSLMSAWNPIPTADKALIHPSRLTTDSIDVENELQLSQLLNRVQRHTVCSKAYCLRGQAQNQKCRFGFPKQCLAESTLAADDKGNFVFIPRRNDCLLNPYNKFVSQAWRANTDFQIIASEHAIVAYITKYASKSEPSSENFKDIFKRIAEQMSNNDPASKAITKLLMKMISQRDVSACEVMHILLGEGLYHSSRSFVKLFISTQEYVPISNRNQDEEHRTHNKLINAYALRHESLENLSLCEFTRKFSATGSRNRSERIVQLIPRVVFGTGEETDEIYCKQKLVFNLPWRDMNQLKTQSSWKESFASVNITTWELPQIVADEDPEEESQEAVRDPHEWMALAEAMPGIAPEMVDLGFREIDRAMNWNRGIERYPEAARDLNFIKASKEAFVRNNESNSMLVQLNSDQSRVISFVNSALNSLTEAKLAIVIGAAGTGKSCIINEIVRLIGNEKVLLMAPTGVAANNINGQTIHSALRLSNYQQRDMSAEKLQQFQEEMAAIEIVIIDEFSMIGLKLLGQIDHRLRQARPLNEIMGGYIVVFFGDFNQLQPVGDVPLYGTPKSSNTVAVQGQIVYRHINKVFLLNQIMRQVGDDQKQFRDCLHRLAVGEITASDYKLIETRFISKHQSTVCSTRDVIRLISTNKEIESFNLEKLRNVGQPVVRITATHNDPRAATASSDDARGLASELYLCKGAQVILRQNLFTAAGLCNGTIGKVVDIVYNHREDSRFSDDFPICIMVEFASYSGPKLQNSNILPIPPVTVSFKKGSNTFTRKQFPIQLAYAISIHRSQGLTLDQAVVNIGDTEFALGMSYVAFSRVRNINGLFFEPGFPFERIKKINEKKKLAEKRIELNRLKQLSERQSI